MIELIFASALPKISKDWLYIITERELRYLSDNFGLSWWLSGKESTCQSMEEMRVRSLGQEAPLEEEMAIHSSILTWKIPWMEEADRLGGLQSMGSQRVIHDSATNTFTFMEANS